MKLDTFGHKVKQLRLQGVGDADARENKKGNPKRRYLDVMKEDMQDVGGWEDEVFDRSFMEI